MVAHCAERSHSWLYIRTVSHDAPAGHGSKMDYFSLAGNFRLMVVEGSFAKEAVEAGVIIQYIAGVTVLCIGSIQQPYTNEKIPVYYLHTCIF